jgi:hypothetical protein
VLKKSPQPFTMPHCLCVKPDDQSLITISISAALGEAADLGEVSASE